MFILVDFVLISFTVFLIIFVVVWECLFDPNFPMKRRLFLGLKDFLQTSSNHNSTGNFNIIISSSSSHNSNIALAEHLRQTQITCGKPPINYSQVTDI